MVDDTIDDRRGHVVVTEYRAPSGEFEICRQDQRLFLVGVGDDLEEESGSLGIDGQVPEFVDLCRHPHRSMTNNVFLPRRASSLSSRPVSAARRRWVTRLAVVKNLAAIPC